jgi:hypothetical protein
MRPHLSPPLMWQREAYDSVLESAHKVSDRMQRRVLELAERYPDGPWHDLPHPEPAPPDLRSAARTNAQVPLQVWIPEVMEVVLYSSTMDRSEGGLSLCSALPLDPGTILYVRHAEATEEGTWIPLEVRHCRPDSTGWTLGCQYTCADTLS